MNSTTSSGDAFDPFRTFSHDGFEVRMYLAPGTPGFFVGHVDVYEGGSHKCRIVLAGQLDHGAAVISLEGKCKDWIAARGRGEPDGNTDFGRL